MKIYKTNKQRVLYLNSTNAIKTTNSSSKNTYFSWNVPDVVINELATLQVGSIGSQGTATDTKIYTFRITGVCSDNTSSFSTTIQGQRAMGCTKILDRRTFCCICPGGV